MNVLTLLHNAVVEPKDYTRVDPGGVASGLFSRIDQDLHRILVTREYVACLQEMIRLDQKRLAEEVPALQRQTKNEIAELDSAVAVLQANLEKIRKRKISSIEDADRAKQDMADCQSAIDAKLLAITELQDYLDHGLPAAKAGIERAIEVYNIKLNDLVIKNGNKRPPIKPAG